MHGVCRVIILAVLPMAHGGSVSAGWLDVDLARCRRDRSVEETFLRHHPVHRRVLVVWRIERNEFSLILSFIWEEKVEIEIITGDNRWKFGFMVEQVVEIVRINWDRLEGGYNGG